MSEAKPMRSIEEAHKLATEIMHSKLVDLNLKIAIIATISYLADYDPLKYTNEHVVKLIKEMPSVSLFPKDSKAVELEQHMLCVMHNLTTQDIEINETFLKDHKPLDPLILETPSSIKDLSPEQLIDNFRDIIDDLGNIILYLLRASDLTEVTIPREVRDRQVNMVWALQQRLEETDPILFRFKTLKDK